jgi:hypothetical protein
MRRKAYLTVGILCGVVLSAGPALAMGSVPLPEPTTLTLLASAGAVAGAIGLGRRWRKRREANRRRHEP